MSTLLNVDVNNIDVDSKLLGVACDVWILLAILNTVCNLVEVEYIYQYLLLH